MPKRLIFLYRYITAPYRLRKWFNAQTVVVLLVTLVFLAALIGTMPLSTFGEREAALPAAPTLDPAAGPTLTPLPADFLTNSQQTIGITLAGAVLVLIVVIGVLVFLPRMEEDGG
jgi:hypothetical protein